jgi:nucleoside phosphorylase
MIFFVTALPVEAKPIIDRYHLKQTNLHSFRLFESDLVNLVITGTGKISSAIGVALMLSRYHDSEKSVLIQIGFAGTEDRQMPIGSLWMIHKITDNATGRDYYPDMIWDHPFQETSVTTVDRVINVNQKHIAEGSLFDMEASGFFQAGTSFMKTHQIFCFKIVSDYCDRENCSASELRELMDSNLDTVFQFIGGVHEHLKNIQNQDESLYSTDLLTLKRKLQLTETQYHQLRYAVKAYQIRLKKDLSVLKPFYTASVIGQSSRDEIFENIIHELNQ